MDGGRDLDGRVQDEADRIQRQHNSGRIFRPGETHVGQDGRHYETPGDAERMETGPVTNLPPGAFVCPEGLIWESEAAYRAWRDGQNQTGTPEVEGNFFVAPDGSGAWVSEAEWRAWRDGQNTTGPGTGEVINDPDFFHAPDGSVWTSRADWEAYESSKTVQAVGTSATIEGSAFEESNFYTCPEGTVWASEADWRAYNSAKSDTTEVAVVQSAEVAPVAAIAEIEPAVAEIAPVAEVVQVAEVAQIAEYIEAAMEVIEAEEDSYAR